MYLYPFAWEEGIVIPGRWAEFELVTDPRLLTELLAEDELVLVQQEMSVLLLVSEDMCSSLVLGQH